MTTRHILLTLAALASHVCAAGSEVAAPAESPAPASPAATGTESPAAPDAAPTPSPEALKVVQDTIALFSALDAIVASDKTVEEKVAAILSQKQSAAALGRAVKSVGEDALALAAGTVELPEFAALDAAGETPELRDALEEVFLSIMAGADAEESPAREEEEEAPVGDPAALKEASDFIMHYFQKPEPDKIDALITQWAGLFPSVRQCDAIPSTLIFFGELFKAHPDRVEGWMKTASTLPQDWQEVFAWSQRYAKGEEPDVTASERATPATLDACWGGFMASGDKKYPEFVLKVACSDEAPNVIDMTVHAAVWSCSSFIINYPEMKEIARAWFTQASEAQRENFALRANAQVQQAVFDKVLYTEEQQEEHRRQLMESEDGDEEDSGESAETEAEANGADGGPEAVPAQA